MQSINLRKGEAEVKNYFSTRSETFQVWSPSIFDNDRNPKSMEKEVRDFYQDGQRGITPDDDSDWKSQRNGNDNIL